MQLFIANKGMMLNVGLNELKNMKPEEMFIFVKEMRKISNEMEKAKNNGI